MEKIIRKKPGARRQRVEAACNAASMNSTPGRLEEKLAAISKAVASVDTKILDVLIRLERGDARFDAHTDRICRLEMVVYGAVGLICVAVFSALVYMVVKK